MFKKSGSKVEHDQCDQMLELKVAQFHQMAEESSKISFFIKRGVLRCHIKLPNICANLVRESVAKTFQKYPNLVTLNIATAIRLNDV